MMPCDWRGSEIGFGYSRWENDVWAFETQTRATAIWHSYSEKTSLLSNLTRMLKLSRGVKNQSQSICYSSQGHARSLNLRKKLSLQRTGDQPCYRCFGNYDHESRLFKKEKCHHCNRTDHIVRAYKSKKRETQAARPPVNYVDSDDRDSDDYLGSLEVNNVSDKDHMI